MTSKKRYDGILTPGSKEESLCARIDFERLPHHIAVIMDGNGRWAKARHRPRVEGHRAGIDAVRDVVETSARLGIEALTLYAFSQENWKRPRLEVKTLMLLLRKFLHKELPKLLENNIRFRPIGRIEGLPEGVQKDLAMAIERTSGLTGLRFQIALNYGGRMEIVDAVNKLIQQGHTQEIDEQAISSALYAPDVPDPDLLVRTSGELRVSNFLLWQIAYSEIWVTKTLWPDFRKVHLFEAILAYQERERRFGDVAPAAAKERA